MTKSVPAGVSPVQSQLESKVDEEAIQRVFEKQRKRAIELRTTTAETRIEKIEKLRDAVLAHRDEIYAACAADFRKPEPEVDIGEVMPIVAEANATIRHLPGWMKPVSVRPTMAMLGTKAKILRQPLGVTLIVAPWNYPVNLALSPLITAIAAGNTAIVKPSEMTPHASALVRKIVEECFDEDEVAVFEGDAAVAQALLELPLDHIFFTGSPAIGKVVMAAAAKHLTKVTLELGGKSPTIVDRSADIKHTAKSIAFGKWTNNGQTCIAPDYVYVHEDVKDALVAEIGKVLGKAYGGDAASSPDYARIVNDRHHGRLASMLQEALDKGAKVETGGQVRGDGENFIAPTVLTNVDRDGRIMNEEIFGPLLPIITYGDIGEAIRYVNANPKPLALYVYAKDRNVIDRVLTETSSGDACINTSVVHYLHLNVPFGGVNNSGLGKSHGLHGFLAFSHERSVVEDKFSSSLMMAPPYTNSVKKMIKAAIRWFT